MTSHSEAPKVYAAINKVTEILARDGISKDRENTQQRFKFRGIDDVYNALAPALVEAGLVMLPRVVACDFTERLVGKEKNVWTACVVTVEFTLASALDGSSITITSVGEAQDNGDKSAGKAQSYAYKAAAFAAFCIPTEGDNDPDAKTPPPREKAPEPKREQPAAKPPAARNYNIWIFRSKKAGPDGKGARTEKHEGHDIRDEQQVSDETLGTYLTRLKNWHDHDRTSPETRADLLKYIDAVEVEIDRRAEAAARLNDDIPF